MSFPLLFRLQAVLWALCFLHNGDAAEPDVRVLFLSSYHSEFPTAEQHLDAINTLFDKRGRYLDLIYMDTKRLPRESQYPLVFDQIAEKIRQAGEYDLVFAADDNALSFLLEKKGELMGEVPVFFFGINNPSLAEVAVQRDDYFGVLEQSSLLENVELAFKLIPRLKDLYVIVDASPSGQADLKNRQRPINC